MKTAVLKRLIPAMFVLASCDVGGAHDEGASGRARTGHASFALTLAEDVDVDQITYTLTQPDGYRSSGAISLATSNHTFKVVMALPVADGYTLAANATAADGATCSGSATFRIQADHQTPITILMHCQASGNLGSVDANGVLNICPTVKAIVVRPIPGGTSFELLASGFDTDRGPMALSFAWSATSGVFSNSIAPNTTLHCTVPGTLAATLTLYDGDDACHASSLDLHLVCPDATSNGDGGMQAQSDRDAAVEPIDAGSIVAPELDSGSESDSN